MPYLDQNYVLRKMLHVPVRCVNAKRTVIVYTKFCIPRKQRHPHIRRGLHHRIWHRIRNFCTHVVPKGYGVTFCRTSYTDYIRFIYDPCATLLCDKTVTPYTRYAQGIRGVKKYVYDAVYGVVDDVVRTRNIRSVFLDKFATLPVKS